MFSKTGIKGVKVFTMKPRMNIFMSERCPDLQISQSLYYSLYYLIFVNLCHKINEKEPNSDVNFDKRDLMSVLSLILTQKNVKK